MNIEYEVRLLEVDVQDFIKKLEQVGAEFQWDRLQRRYVYDFKPKVEGKWIRLRTNGVDTTLTIKNIVSSKIDGMEELELVVDDFEKCNLILNELGYIPKGYQENRRIHYLLNGVEIDLDFWPHIPTYVEIEGKSKSEVYGFLSILGYQKDDVTSIDVESIYKKYGYQLEDIFELKLEEERK